MTPRRLSVSKAGRIVLDVLDEPGPLTSTALAPPGFEPPQHPFVTASARDPEAEHELREILDASASTDDFIERLRAAGYEVAPG